DRHAVPRLRRRRLLGLQARRLARSHARRPAASRSHARGRHRPHAVGGLLHQHRPRPPLHDALRDQRRPPVSQRRSPFPGAVRMKLSLEWLREFVELPADVTPQRIAERLTMSTVEVEQVHEIGRELDGIVVAEVRGVEPHPANPSLTIAAVDHGGGSAKIVCGATNVAVGMKAALAREGAVVRNAHGEPFTVARTAIRGVESAGMLCSPVECGLNHLFSAGEKEILDLTALEARTGTPLAKAIGYDDVVFEIDNKSLTNRPDLWGHHGIARELAAMFDRPLQEPPQFGALPSSGGFDVRIEAPELCARYSATQISGVSP